MKSPGGARKVSEMRKRFKRTSAPQRWRTFPYARASGPAGRAILRSTPGKPTTQKKCYVSTVPHTEETSRLLGCGGIQLWPGGYYMEGAALFPEGQARGFCKRSGCDAPGRLMGRARYCCSVGNFPYVCDGAATIRPHEQGRLEEYVWLYYSSVKTRAAKKGRAHYHCDICSMSPNQVRRLGQH